MIGEYEVLYTPVHIFSVLATQPSEAYVLMKKVRAVRGLRALRAGMVHTELVLLLQVRDACMLVCWSFTCEVKPCLFCGHLQ
jgi:hypothetical protein